MYKLEFLLFLCLFFLKLGVSTTLTSSQLAELHNGKGWTQAQIESQFKKIVNQQGHVIIKDQK